MKRSRTETLRVWVLAVSFVLLPLPATVFANDQVEAVLARQDPPPGVVFEIATADGEALGRVLPPVRQWVRRLHTRFADLPIAIVSHGREQFALQSSREQEQPRVHSLTRSLREEGVTLHVCGTYAGWQGLSEEDFPDYVDVAAAGPVQVNDYRALGFIVIRITSVD